MVGEPDNLLGWGVRGRQDDALVERAVAGFAAAKWVARTEVEHEVLFVGDNDPGQVYGDGLSTGRAPQPQLGFSA